MKKLMDTYIKVLNEEKSDNVYWANIAVKIFVPKNVKNQKAEAKKLANEIVNKISNARLLNIDID